MCLQTMDGMVVSKSMTQKLISALRKQNEFYSIQNLKELTTDEYQQYLRMRNACVHYIRVPHIYFGTRPDVFATAVSLLDIFLWKVKISTKHMTIVSAACFLIACKMLEEEEIQPTASQLAYLPSHEWTANDLCRMELHILKKVDWSVTTVSYVEFLPLFAELSGRDVPTVCTNAIISLAERCLTQQSTIVVKPLAFALCLFNHATNIIHPQQSQAINPELKELKTLSNEVYECQKNILFQSASQNMLLPSQVPRRSAAFPVKLFDRPSVCGSPCLPTIMEE